jgi:N-acetylmuramoyl-L-alanine amidase
MAIAVYDVHDKYIAKTAEKPAMRTHTNYIVVHHAAAVYSPGKACQSIFNYHSTKWPKYGRIGYQIVLQAEVNGTIARYNVNPPDIQGANVAMRNHEVIGVCMATNLVGLIPNNWFVALVETVRAVQLMYPHAKVVGHKEIALKAYATQCPGVRWANWKAALYAAL